MAADLYQHITSLIIQDLENGVKPWERSWGTSAPSGHALPHNTTSGHIYRGINTLTLWMQARGRGFPTHGWMTFAQAHSIGARVRKGEKGTPVVYVGRITDEESQTCKAFAKWSYVFNVAQIDGLDDEHHLGSAPEFPEYESLANAIAGMEVMVTHASYRACYRPTYDVIEMPDVRSFKSADAWARTLAHELVHATGHAKRLNRESGKRFGDYAYAHEELVAEMGAAFFCSQAGIEYDTESAEYIGGWLDRMQKDARYIFTAAGAAGRASEYLWAKHLEVQTEKANGTFIERPKLI